MRQAEVRLEPTQTPQGPRAALLGEAPAPGTPVGCLCSCSALARGGSISHAGTVACPPHPLVLGAEGSALGEPSRPCSPITVGPMPRRACSRDSGQGCPSPHPQRGASCLSARQDLPHVLGKAAGAGPAGTHGPLGPPPRADNPAFGSAPGCFLAQPRNPCQAGILGARAGGAGDP